MVYRNPLIKLILNVNQYEWVRRYAVHDALDIIILGSLKEGTRKAPHHGPVLKDRDGASDGASDGGNAQHPRASMKPAGTTSMRRARRTQLRAESAA